MVLISIIIPIYNVEQYVQRCLESVIAQENIDINLECIIVDDCSPDKSMHFVNSLLAKYKGKVRFRIIKHEKNCGLSAARNTGILHANGDYVMFIDSDDYLLPNSIQYFVRYLNLYPDVDLIMGNVKSIKDDSLLIQNINEPLLISDRNVFFQRFLRHDIYLFAWNKLIKRKMLIDNKIFFKEGIIYEDQCWSYQLFSSFYSVLLLPQVTYVYENNPQSIVNTTFTQEHAELAIHSYAVSTTYMLDNPPKSYRYQRNMTVDYLLFMCYFLMKGVDLESKFAVTSDTISEYRLVCIRLRSRSLRYGRLLLSLFFMQLFTPMSYIQRLRWFRKYYRKIEFVINRLAHATDFLHNKHR